MPVLNNEISEVFEKVADLLDIKGSNQFRVRAYRRAARSIANKSSNIRDMIEEDKNLTDIDGIGEDLAGKIREIVETGSLSELEELKQEMPSELIDMLNLPGLGPKRVKAIYENLDVDNLEDLRAAAESDEIKSLSGFGEKTEKKILEGIKDRKKQDERYLLSIAEEYARPLKKYIEKIDGVEKVKVAGSYRRRKETVGDLDIVVVCNKTKKLMEEFKQYEDVDEIVSSGETKSTIVLKSGLQVDLRAIDRESYGAALIYFTGSKSHNIALRKIAQDRGFKVNEYGVFDGEKKLAGKDEKDLYDILNLPYILPELREKRGEIEAARKGNLPDLVSYDDIRGDLQVHTDATDGNNSLKEMVEAACEYGYEYIAITDHSKRVSMAGGLNGDELLEQIEEIERLNEEYEDITILKSVEVDILKDGSLDLSDSILKKMDLCICSVHYNRKLSRQKQTERIMKAMENPYFNILAHPTGRKIQERKGLDIDLNKIMEKAVETGCFLEINAQPDRLDLADKYCRQAGEMGLKLAISTDAHSVGGLEYMSYGVDQARRGWLGSEAIINTYSLERLLDLIKRD